MRAAEDRRDKLCQYAPGLRELVTRMQRRELDRDRWLRKNIRIAYARGGDRGNRVGISGLVAPGVGGGQRRLAEHVERVAKRGVGPGAAALERFADGAPHHELLGHQLHRLPQGEPNDRFAGSGDDTLVPRSGIARGVGVDLRKLAGEHQAPGRGVHQQRWALAQVLLPVTARELVTDQSVRGRGVGNAQQRFGHAHQQHALLCRQVVLVQERFHAGAVGVARAHGFDPAAGT